MLAWVFRATPCPTPPWWPTITAYASGARCGRSPRSTAAPPGDPRGDPADTRYTTRCRSSELLRRIPTLRGSICRRPGAISRCGPRRWWDARHLSLHPGGVVIVPGALTDYVPVEPAAKTLDPSLSTLPDRSGHPVREGRRRRRGAGQDRSARQSLPGGHPRRHRRGADEYRPPDRLHHRRGGRGRGHEGAIPHRADDGRLLHRIAGLADPLRQEPGRGLRDLVLNTSIIRPASNRFIRIYLERLHGAPTSPSTPACGTSSPIPSG